MSISTIRTKIKEKLDTLVTSSDLGCVVNQSFKHHPLADPNVSRFPAAVIQPPTLESEINDTASNNRTYTFDIVVIMKGDDISSVSDVENLIETICDAFDDDFTLGGTVTGGLEPATSPVVQDEYNGKQIVMFSIILKAKTCYNLGN